MAAIELFMNSLAGLGILFFGIKMVTRNLGAVAGSGLRSGITRVSRQPLGAMAAGGLLGFVSQSGRTSSFIMASFVHAGIVDVRTALPVVLWANLGCALVIVAAVFPLHLFALFVLALAGAAIAFERPRPMLKSASAVFGLALMLFGLRMMSQAAVALTDQGLFSDAIAFIQASLPLGFFCGLVLTFVAQSHMAIMLISVAMAGQGIFGVQETLMLVFGAHVGSSLITYFTGFNFHGEARQVVLAEILYNPVAVLLFLLAFLGDRLLADGAGLASIAAATGAGPGLIAVMVAIAANAVAPLALVLLRDPYLHLCERLSPPLPEEELGHPRYLHNDMVESPHTTLLLAEKEQLRLFERLPTYSAALKQDGAARGDPSPTACHEAFAMVSATIENAQSALMAREMSDADTEWLLGQQKRQHLLHTLDDACFELWEAAHALDEHLLEMRGQIVAELDTLLELADDAMKMSNPADFPLIEEKTRDCGERMERMRREYLAGDHPHTAQERSQILALTSIYERIAWAIRRLSASLEKRPALKG